MNIFKEFWKANNGGEAFEKASLSKAEIMEVQDRISALKKRNYPSSKIITALQKLNPKLNERWKAERAYWTETKKDDSEIIGESGEDLGISKYKVILAPHPCKVCISKTDNGGKVFKNADLAKSGYGHVPPFHPNCYCIIYPFG